MMTPATIAACEDLRNAYVQCGFAIAALQRIDVANPYDQEHDADARGEAHLHTAEASALVSRALGALGRPGVPLPDVAAPTARTRDIANAQAVPRELSQLTVLRAMIADMLRAEARAAGVPALGALPDDLPDPILLRPQHWRIAIVAGPVVGALSTFAPPLEDGPLLPALWVFALAATVWGIQDGLRWRAARRKFDEGG